tara:strand:+ start:1119 stop:1958 length:840 start_codon:yes stop_codon:yes gene_type:complete
MNLFQALENGYNLLKTNNINSYKIDTELLLSDSLNISKERLILNLKRGINSETYNNFLLKINRRRAKEPIAYILKKKEFWKNEFYIDKNVLIPRPETEHLVEETLKIISINQKKRLLEIGVGSGCLIISVLKERINCSAFTIDCCKNAIKIAKINAKLHQVQNRINIFKTDVDNLNSGKYDLILSNPPYIDKHKLRYLGVSKYEPTKALNGGINGTEILIKVVKKSSKLLKINGKLIVEIGSDQKYKMINILKKNKFYINKITKDLSNLDRCITSTKIA